MLNQTYHQTTINIATLFISIYKVHTTAAFLANRSDGHHLTAPSRLSNASPGLRSLRGSFLFTVTSTCRRSFFF